MIIENAKWFLNPYDNKEKIGVSCTIDNKNVTVPMNENNRHYKEILKQVAEGTLTIQDAE